MEIPYWIQITGPTCPVTPSSSFCIHSYIQNWALHLQVLFKYLRMRNGFRLRFYILSGLPKPNPLRVHLTDPSMPGHCLHCTDCRAGFTRRVGRHQPVLNLPSISSPEGMKIKPVALMPCTQLPPSQAQPKCLSFPQSQSWRSLMGFYRLLPFRMPNISPEALGLAAAISLCPQKAKEQKLWGKRLKMD